MKSNVINRIELPTLKESDGSKSGTSLGERLDLVEHVQVKLDVIVGQANLQIDRLFSLSAGEVLPLSSGVDDPLEVHLNGKLIARGELVAVGEQFGLRVTEIVP